MNNSYKIVDIGILTFHRALNAGACLQAFALENFLQENNFQVEIIDYIPNSEIDNRSLKRKILHLFRLCLDIRLIKHTITAKKYRKFRQNYMVLSNKSYYGDHDENLKNIKYNILISGSDQIFNLPLSGYSFTYYLPFENIKKISYASSFGRSNISDIEKWCILKFLPHFDALSFRETDGLNLTKSLINCDNASLVLDPVFLLESNKWLGIIDKKIHLHKYILIYAMENNSWLDSTIEKVSQMNHDHRLILIKGANFSIKIKNIYKCYVSPDPKVFLSLIYGADMIITNSFHGLAFSFIFGKEVYCCAHSKRNSRIETLANLVGQKDIIISNDSSEYKCIDGQKAYAHLNELINKSKRYLLESIRGNKNDN